MSEIISELRQTCKNFPSQTTNGSRHPNNLFDTPAANESLNLTEIDRELTDLESRILYFYYEEWQLLGQPSDRSLEELGKRLSAHPHNISTAISYLANINFLKRIHNGCKSKKTCITWEGFTYSENQPRSQIRSQNEFIPYIDLSKNKDLDLSYLENPEACEQLFEDPNESLENKLDVFLMSQKTPYGQREKIKDDLKSSRIGPVRILKIIARAAKASLKKSITSVRSYIRACIERERKELTDLFVLLKDKNLPFYQYAEQ